MAERNLDFDTVVDRRNTNCLKYDFAVYRGKPENVLPLWVADMDFKVSSYIEDAIINQARHGIYGYSEVAEEYFQVLKNWNYKHYNWNIERKWLVKTPGIVFALALAVKAFSKKGESVLIQQPVYYPFSEVILDNERNLVDNTLVLQEDGSYKIDFEDFERKIVENNVKLYFLCNPHNPVGRVWTKEELTALGDICLKHKVIVVSDEIHADFDYTGRHIVFADLKEEYKDISITCMAPSKTFNIAGLQLSNIFIPNRELKQRFKKEIAAAGYSQLNAVGLVAAKAAYENGEEWYQAMLSYVKDNIEYTRKYLEENLPVLKMTKPEGTYLVWIDFKGLGLSDEELEDLIINKAGLWLDSGLVFGKAGKGFQRINVACPRKTLQLALDKLKSSIDNIAL